MDRKQKAKQTVKYSPKKFRVTSYADFLQKMQNQKQNISVTSIKHQQISKQSTTPSNGAKTARQITRCTTQSCYPETQRDHLVSKESNTQTFVSGAFVSVHNDLDWEQPQNNKENTYTQPKSCSRNKSRHKHNTSIETHIELPSKKKTAEAANFLLNELKLIVQSITKFNRQRITYLDYLQILREFNMIQNNYEPSKEDAVFKLWEVLTAGRDNYTCLINLAIALLAVMRVGIKISTVKEFFSGICFSLDDARSLAHHNNKKHPVKEYKRNKQGLLDLSPVDIAEIHSNFKELRVTRMFLGRIAKKSDMLEEKLERYSNHSFRPHVSERSRSLAKRKKLKDTSVRHLESVEPVEQHCLTDRVANEIDDCTFQPKTTRNHNEQPLSPSLGLRRTQLLYQLAKRKSKEKKDRHPDEIELEKNKQLYTFKPSKTANCFRKSLEKQKVQGETKQINRMMKARVERQVTEKASEKGLPYNVKEMAKIRRKVTDELVHQMLTKKASDKLQDCLDQVKKVMDPAHENGVDPVTKNGGIRRQAGITESINSSLKNEENHEHHCDSIFAYPEVKSEEGKEEPTQQHNSGSTTQETSKARRQLFTFEVFLEEDVCLDRITLRQGDSPQELAAAFVAHHGLKPEMEGKLIKALYAHLLQLIEKDQLGRIDEQSVEYSVDF